jgi:hypothetical protein
MLILFVNGIPAIKLASRADIPPRAGRESWWVVDDRGRTIAAYRPK